MTQFMQVGACYENKKGRIKRQILRNCFQIRTDILKLLFNTILLQLCYYIYAIRNIFLVMIKLS